MAIINNNVQNVQFLRNQTPFASREAALTQIETAKSNSIDGSAILARYTDTVEGNTVIKTLVGFVAVSGNNKYLTIFDVDGASADVEALRQQMENTFGTGVTTANTATAQLAALSGATFTAGTSSSADTSVEGAKAYAYDLLGTIDYTDTAVEGEYVSQVTQTDGVIAVTRVALPSSADTAVDLKLVTAVAEDKGQITVSRGEITSSNKTIILSANTDGGVDFKANVDGETIIIDQETGEMSVANSALIQYAGDEKTINVSEAVAGVKTISSLLTLSSVTPSSTTVKEEYALKNASGETIGSTIKIYKDSSLYSAYLGHVDDTITSADDPTVVPGTGDTALCFIYLKTDGTYELVAVNVEEFIEENEFASGVTWDNVAKKVKGVVDPQSEKDSQDTPVDFLTVGADGFKINGIKDEIDRKLAAIVEDLDADESGSTAHVSVRVEEADGKITAVTVAEDNIANADDLAALSAKTITEVGSSNASISATTAATADGTVGVDLVTDASKIKMSGFTSTDVLSGITPASSVTEAFEEVDRVITENEQITSEALNDLNSRINTVSGEVETLTTDSLSGITVNGNVVTPVNHVAPLAIDSTSAATTSNEGKAIVVTTNNDGSVTLNLATLDCGYYQ